MSVLQIQLFPLQTVLYPHCVLPLHIFEKRYRTMIQMCVEHRVPFGVVQITNGVEVGGRANTYSIGTIANIKNVTEFADGRMFINTVGDKRFRIMQSAYDGECMTAHVELIEDEPFQLAGLQPLAQSVGKQFKKYWQLLELAMNRDLGKIELPEEPDVMSWLIPSVLHVQPELKQTILTKRSVQARLELEQELLEEELEKLQEMMREARGE